MVRKNFRRRRMRKGKSLNPKQKKEVKMILSRQLEHKWLAVGVDQSVTSAGSIVPLDSVTQGTSSNQRVGDRINLTRLIFQWSARSSANTLLASADTYNNTRCIIFRWHDMNYNTGGAVSSLPVLTDILDNTAATPTVAPYNYENRDRYHIVYDSCLTTFNMPTWNGTATLYNPGPDSYKVAFKKPHVITGRRLGKKYIDYLPSNYAYGTNRLYLLLVSDSTFTPHPFAQFCGQIDYTDA